LVSGALFTVIGFVISIFLPVFYVLFTMFNSGEPWAGDGFGVVVSFYFNARIFIAAAVIGFVKIMIKNRIASKKQMEL
jgi:hypothetical protein